MIESRLAFFLWGVEGQVKGPASFLILSPLRVKILVLQQPGARDGAFFPGSVNPLPFAEELAEPLYRRFGQTSCLSHKHPLVKFHVASSSSSLTN